MIVRVARQLGQVARRKSARATSWAMLGQLSAIIASTANFLLLARLVGPTEYGIIAGSWALVLAAAPIAALGADRLLMRDVSAGHLPPAQALGAALVTLAMGCVVIIGALVSLHSVLLPQTPLALLVSLALAEIVAMGMVVLVTALFFATSNARAAGITSVVVNATKLLAVVTFAVSGDGDPVHWAMIYAGYAVVSALGQLAVAIRRFGRPSVKSYHFVARARDGLPYSGNVVATVVQNDADKTLLLRNGLGADVGHYSVAYRLASMAYLPVLAVMQAMLPRYFAVGGEGGLPATTAFARRLAKPLLAYGVAATVVVIAVAPLVPVAVGEEYRESVALLALLAPLVLAKVVQTVVGDALTGAGRQRTRTLCVSIAAATNVSINLALIPILGLTGALVATFVAEVLQASLLCLAVYLGLRRSPRDSTGPVEPALRTPPAPPPSSNS